MATEKKPFLMEAVFEGEFKDGLRNGRGKIPFLMEPLMKAIHR